ncbi:gag-pol polyprotein [Tanacetum coccineum]
MYNSQETTKPDPKSRKCLFLGYADGVKGYRLWDPTAHKVVVSRDVVFMEDKIQENEESDSTTRETTSIQMENEFQSNDSFKAAPQHEVNETNESQAPATRTLNRERSRPGWHSNYVMESNVAYCLLTEEREPSTLQEALNNPDASFWRKPIGNKWVYKIKRNGDDQVERYHARLVVKGYAQKKGINFNEIFSPVVRMTTVRVVLAMCATPDIAYVVGVVSRYMVEPGRGRWEAVKRILRYIKGTSDVALCFGDSDLIVTGYVDSDYAGDLDGSKSTTGYVFTLSGGTVSWVSKLQSVMAMSTTEAEYVAAAQASKEAVWLKMLLEEIEYKQEKITLFCDNQSALYLARNPTFHSKTNHIRV